MKKVLAFVLVFTVAMVGCGGALTMDSLTGKSFTLTNMFEGSEITIMFEGDKFSGNSAVNNFFGSYEIKEGKKFVAGKTGMTMMAGPEPQMEAETKFMEMFNNIDTVSLKKTVLTFKTKDGKELIFEEGIKSVDAEEAMSSAPAKSSTEEKFAKLEKIKDALQGSEVIVMLNKDAYAFKLTNMFEGSEITIMFSDGKISGKAAVNNYMASYTIEDNKFIINSAIGTTRMAGKPEDMKAESGYLAMLPLVVGVSFNDGMLTLKTSDGKELVYKQM